MLKRKWHETGLIGLPIAVLVLLLDWVTKLVAQSYLQPYTPKAVFAGFNLTLAYNRGSAFSFLANASGWQVGVLSLLAIIVSLMLLIWLSRISRKAVMLTVALNLIIGGALGNMLDRLMHGHVVDFIDLYVKHWHWPAFNVADSAICIGAVLLLLSQWTGRDSQGENGE